MTIYTSDTTLAGLLKDLPASFGAELLWGQHLLDRSIGPTCVQQTGLALAGLFSHLDRASIQVLGRAELAYLRRLPAAQRASVLRRLCALEPPLLVLASGQRCPEPIRAAAERHRIPILRARVGADEVVAVLVEQLRAALSPRASMHGTLMDIFGVGVLLTGRSSIGKSECALELILRGHPLVADDVVEVSRHGSYLIGRSPELVRNHLEIRGLGIVNVCDLFGIVAVRERKNLHLVIELLEWRPGQEVERLGLEERSLEILGVSLPRLVLPVRPGRNLGTIVEVAARNELLKRAGIHTALALKHRLDEILASRSRSAP